MRIIVSDSSALIDLKKGRLLETFLRLPYEFIVSDAMLADELLSFTESEVAMMRRAMTVTTLDSGQMSRARQEQFRCPALTTYDCFAFILARDNVNSILLTGDRRMREKAHAEGIECHGVLWIIEEIEKARLAPGKTLLKALQIWRSDTVVRLPSVELGHLIARYRRK